MLNVFKLCKLGRKARGRGNGKIKASFAPGTVCAVCGFKIQSSPRRNGAVYDEPADIKIETILKTGEIAFYTELSVPSRGEGLSLSTL